MPPAIRALTAALLVVAVFGVAVAKLPPAPPQTEEQKAAKKAKDDAAAQLAKEQQARAEDRVVSKYIADQKAKGNTVTPQIGPTSGAGAATATPVITPPKAPGAPPVVTAPAAKQ